MVAPSLSAVDEEGRTMGVRGTKKATFVDCRLCRHGEHEYNNMCFCRVLKMFRSCGKRYCDYFSFAGDDGSEGRRG